MKTLLPALALCTVAFAHPTFAQEGSARQERSGAGRLFFLDIRGGRVMTANTDGNELRTILEGNKNSPDGIDVDTATGFIYWSNMGRPMDDDGSVERVAMDGSQHSYVVPVGGTFTAKQMKLDRANRKMYWSDREGMRVMRANMDGSNVETLVEVARGDAQRYDASNWCVGIAIDVAGGKVYWSQKGPDNGYTGSIRRANIEIPKGQTAANRKDIEVLFDGLPEPIDLDLDLSKRMIYWTDRGDAPNGNNVSRAPMDMAKGATASTRRDREIVMRDLDEGIGIALDLDGDRMFVTDLRGNLYTARLNGAERRVLRTGLGSLTGIAYAEP